MAGGFEIIEHTADVGVRAWGGSLEECFEQSAFGVLAINGAYKQGDGYLITVTLDANDVGGLLVDWISEVLYLHESRDAVVTAVELFNVDERSLIGSISLEPRRGDIEGTAVKAVTYHRLSVAPTPYGWAATFYLDV